MFALFIIMRRCVWELDCLIPTTPKMVHLAWPLEIRQSMPIPIHANQYHRHMDGMVNNTSRHADFGAGNLCVDIVDVFRECVDLCCV